MMAALCAVCLPRPNPACPPSLQTGLALNINMAATAMLEAGELADFMCVGACAPRLPFLPFLLSSQLPCLQSTGSMRPLDSPPAPHVACRCLPGLL